MTDPIKKKYIISGALFGVIYASFMAGFDFLTEQPFSIYKLIFNVLVIGALIGYINYRAVKNAEGKLKK